MPRAHDQVVDALLEAGWLPPDHEIDAARRGNLLPSLLSAMEGATSLRARVEESLANGASLKVLDSREGSVSSWLGQRLIYSPQLYPSGCLVGLSSSRLGRRLDNQQAWFTVFRAACSKLDPGRETLFTADSTTTARFVERAAELFEVPVLSLVTPRRNRSLRTWLDSVTRLEPTCGNVHRAYLSPPIDREQPIPEMASFALRDRAVVAMSDRLLVFHLRRSGQLDSLVRARLSDQRWPDASIYLALGEGLAERQSADELLDLGAIGWVVLDTVRDEQVEASWTDRAHSSAAIVPMPQSDDWPFLTHCTRDQSGAWPDQTDTQFVDELLLPGAAQSRSAIDALERIVATERLVSTHQLVRGDVAVVSFTAVPLSELPKMRSYRSHLGRWDFEPYGICVRREVLEARGASAVRYGDEALWNALRDDERPFFQNNDGQLDVDWSLECEWRHVGDVDLAVLSNDDAIIFVPSRVEAERVATISRWPVAVLGQTE